MASGHEAKGGTYPIGDDANGTTILSRRGCIGIAERRNEAPVLLLRSRCVFPFVLLLFLGLASVSLSFRNAVTVMNRPSVGSFAFQSLEETIRATYNENPISGLSPRGP